MRQNNKKISIWENKKELFPSVISRIPLFTTKKTHEKTQFGELKISKPLSQTHRDILEAIAVVGEKGIYKNNHNQFIFAVDLPELLRFLGHKKTHNHKWLKEKLMELRSICIEITTEKFVLVGGILDKFMYSYKNKREKQYKGVFGENCLFLVVLSEEFSNIFKIDYVIYAKKEVVKAIIDIEHDFVKAVARFCLTHEKVNFEFSDLLQHLGYSNVGERYKRKLREQLLEYQDYLKTHFGIEVVETTKNKKEKRVYVFYQKNPELVAIDYKKDQE